MGLLKSVEMTILPRHVAIIMDGNGRWAQAKGLPRAIGHEKGVETARRTIESAIRLGIKHLTLFGFSSENWNRPSHEVVDLMALLRQYLTKEINELNERGVCFRVIGERDRLASDIVALIERSEQLTSANTDLFLTLALSYGGRRAIVLAAQELVEQASQGILSSDKISESMFEARFETAQHPDPDLIIRTSGEKRISNFMLWECAYSEFVFLDVFWPDFSHEHLSDAILEFGRRNRRYGATI